MKLFMTEDDITKLLKVSECHPRDHAIFHVALATGLRASDLINLKRWDIAPNVGDPIQKSIKIKMIKTGKMVERPLPDACRKALERYLELRIDDNPFLFRSESNRTINYLGPMAHSTMHRIFKRYLGLQFSDESLRGNACHTTRRSVAKIISDRAGRIEPATRFLGHASVAATVAYLDMDGYGRQADEIVLNLFS